MRRNRGSLFSLSLAVSIVGSLLGIAALVRPAAAETLAVGRERPVSPVEYGASAGYEERPGAASGGGVTLIAWSDLGYTTIRAARITPEGKVLDTLGIDVSAGPGYRGSPAVTWMGTSFLIVWPDSRTGSTSLMGARVGLDGFVLDPFGFVVSDSASIQSTGTAAWDGSNATVAWTDSRDGSADVFAARVSPAGVVLDPEGIPVTEGAEEKNSVSIGWNGTSYLLSWLQGYGVYAARMGADGSVLDPDPIAVDAPSMPRFHWQPIVASDGAGFLIAWSAGTGVFASRVTSAGTVVDRPGILVWPDPWGIIELDVTWDGANYLVSTASWTGVLAARVTPNAQVLDVPPLAVDDPPVGYGMSAAWDGTSHVLIWTRSIPYTPTDVVAARVGEDGSIVDDVPIVVTTGAEPQSSLAVAAGLDQALVAWQTFGADGFRVEAARVSRAGRPMDRTAIRLPTAEGNDANPAVAWNGSSYLVVWEHRGADRHVVLLGARVAADGSVLDSTPIPVSITGSGQFSPSIASDGERFLVVWSDQRDHGPTIRGTVIGADGRVVDRRGSLIFDGSYHDQFDPDVTWDGTNYVAVWESHGNTGTGVDVYAGRISPGGVPLDPQAIVVSAASGSQVAPTIASSGGTSLVAWGDGRQGPGDVVGARMTASGDILDADGIPLVTLEGREAGLDLDWGGDQYRLVYSDILANGGGDVSAVRIGPDGLVVEGPLAIASSDEVESRPAVALIGTTAIVAYDRFDPAPEVNTLRGYIRSWA